MVPTWGRQNPCGPRVGPMHFPIWVTKQTTGVPKRYKARTGCIIFGDTLFLTVVQIDGLVHDCSNSGALAMELLQFCNKPSRYKSNRGKSTSASIIVFPGKESFLFNRFSFMLIIHWSLTMAPHNALYCAMPYTMHAGGEQGIAVRSQEYIFPK